MRLIRVGQAALYFIIGILFSMVTFYNLINDDTGYMVRWNQIQAQWYNILFTVAFIVLGILKLLEVLAHESK